MSTSMPMSNYANRRASGRWLFWAAIGDVRPSLNWPAIPALRSIPFPRFSGLCGAQPGGCACLLKPIRSLPDTRTTPWAGES